MGGSRDTRRACGGLLEPVGTSLDVFYGLYKSGGTLGHVPRFVKEEE